MNGCLLEWVRNRGHHRLTVAHVHIPMSYPQTTSVRDLPLAALGIQFLACVGCIEEDFARFLRRILRKNSDPIDENLPRNREPAAVLPPMLRNEFGRGLIRFAYA